MASMSARLPVSLAFHSAPCPEAAIAQSEPAARTASSSSVQRPYSSVTRPFTASMRRAAARRALPRRRHR